MPRYNGTALAAGAIGNALSGMFEGMAKGEIIAPQVANSWQNLRTNQQAYDQTGQMNPLLLNEQRLKNAASQQTYDYNTQRYPLELQGLAGANRLTGAQAGTAEEELAYRPTLRQHQGAAERRAGEQHGWLGQDATARAAAAQRDAEKYNRGLAAQAALQQWSAKWNGKIDLSNPQQLQELNGILAQHGTDLGPNPIAQEGARMATPPHSPDALTARLLQRDPSTLNPQERAQVDLWRRDQQAGVDYKAALAEQARSRAGYFDSRHGFGRMETKDLQKAWQNLVNTATSNIGMIMKDTLGVQDATKLGSTLDERMVAQNWLRNIYLAQQLQNQPLLKEYIEAELGRAFPTVEELRQQIPEHLKEKASGMSWFFNSMVGGAKDALRRLSPKSNVEKTPDGWTIEKLD